MTRTIWVILQERRCTRCSSRSVRGRFQGRGWFSCRSRRWSWTSTTSLLRPRPTLWRGLSREKRNPPRGPRTSRRRPPWLLFPKKITSISADRCSSTSTRVLSPGTWSSLGTTSCGFLRGETPSPEGVSRLPERSYSNIPPLGTKNASSLAPETMGSTSCFSTIKRAMSWGGSSWSWRPSSISIRSTSATKTGWRGAILVSTSY